MRIKAAVVAIATVWACGGMLRAQDQFPPVTAVLKSGETIQGGLQDLANELFYIRTSFHSDRRIPRNEVALLDFTGGTRGSDSEFREAGGNTQAMVLRDGSIVRGQFLTIRGGGKKDFNLEVVFRAQSGEERIVPIGQVARLYLGRSPNQQSGTPGLSQGVGAETIRVPANQRWVDTGITVRKGDRVTFNASGQVQLSGNPTDTAGPTGVSSGRYPSGPMPRVIAGALIGRVGPTGFFGIGDQTSPLGMPADGRLYLGVNDDNVSDNQGEFVVQVQPERQPVRRRQ